MIRHHASVVTVLLIACGGGESGGAASTDIGTSSNTGMPGSTAAEADATSAAASSGPVGGTAHGSTDDAADSTGAPATDAVVLYVASGPTLYAFDVDLASGALGEPTTSDIGGDLGPLVVDRARGDLLVADLAAGALAHFAIAPDDGAPSGGARIDVGLAAVYLTIAPTDDRLLVADFTAGRVGVFGLADGAPALPALGETDVGEQPHAIVLDPSGAFAFVPRLSGDEIRQYVFDGGTGVLTPNDVPSVATEAGAGPRHLVFHPDGDVAYLIEENADAIVRLAFDGDTGRLTPLESISTLPDGEDGSESYCADIHITPDRRFVFGSNRGTDTIAGFTIADDKRLVANGHAPTATWPRSFTIDPTGRYVYVAGQNDGTLRSHAIADDGTLAEIATTDVPPAPAWVDAIALP